MSPETTKCNDVAARAVNSGLGETETRGGGAPTGEMPRILRHAMPGHGRTVLVDWSLGNRCNHACSYCPKSLHDGSLGWQDARHIRALFRKLKAHYVDAMGRVVWLQFTGGEPTMHPRIVELLDDAASLGLKVSLISNASRTLRFWDRIQGQLDSAILTYHAEYSAFEHFRDVVELLAGRMPVHVNVAMHKDHFDRLLKDAHAFRAIANVTVSQKPIRVGFGTEMIDYTPEQRKTFGQAVTPSKRQEHSVPRSAMTRVFPSGAWDVVGANELIVTGQNRWPGYVCNAGIESLRVRPDGSVTRAVCEAGGVVGQLGSEFDLPTTPITCPKQACGCVADILITKQRLQGPDAARVPHAR